MFPLDVNISFCPVKCPINLNPYFYLCDNQKFQQYNSSMGDIMTHTMTFVSTHCTSMEGEFPS